VYKLENDKGELYFGISKKINKRWNSHMHNARHDGRCSSKRLWYDDTAVVGMEELEWFEIEEEAHKREVELIKNNNCVNDRKYTFDSKAYTKQYNKKRKEHHKKYLQEQREVINAKSRQKIVCDICGSTVSRNNIAAHKKTNKCKSLKTNDTVNA
jgi:hypothetical protein